ncbi:MAG: DMT family transporter [Gammaproteobacteria bacterium]
MNPKPMDWFVLLALAFIWGSSYLMIELALRVWSPAQITGLRILAAAAVLLVAFWLRGEKWPRSMRAWVYFIAIAVLGNCLPFTLISWGQLELDSGVTSILASSTPLFVIVLAHVMLNDEPVKLVHLFGVVLGFIGVLVLLGHDVQSFFDLSDTSLLAQLAILAATFSYALSTVLTRLMPPSHPLVTSTAVLLIASLIMSPITFQAFRDPLDFTFDAVAAVAFMGVMGTGISALMFFHVVDRCGARFVSLLNYMVPLWAVLLGVIILNERMSKDILAGGTLILFSLILANWRARRDRA